MIEHPDHTGESANPLAPWNQPDPEPEFCDYCDHELDEEDRVLFRDRGVWYTICMRCSEGPTDEEQWAAAEAESLRPAPDTRNEHQV